MMILDKKYSLFQLNYSNVCLLECNEFNLFCTSSKGYKAMKISFLKNRKGFALEKSMLSCSCSMTKVYVCLPRKWKKTNIIEYNNNLFGSG